MLGEHSEVAERGLEVERTARDGGQGEAGCLVANLAEPERAGRADVASVHRTDLVPIAEQRVGLGVVSKSAFINLDGYAQPHQRAANHPGAAGAKTKPDERCG